MIRQIIQIDQDKCNGCGICVNACHEGAIGLINGKATLLRDDYCDGLGDCLPGCPMNAISFVEREALAYDEAAVAEHMKKKQEKKAEETPVFTGCPGTKMRQMNPDIKIVPQTLEAAAPLVSQLRQWPCQIKLAPINAPYFSGAKLLIAADCTAFAYANIHNDFMKGKITLNGCPKLDNVDYSIKLTDILANNDIESVTILRMEVPCCGGLVNAVKKALQNCGKMIPWQVITISIDGDILE